MEVLFDIQPEPLAERVAHVERSSADLHRGGRHRGRAAGVIVERRESGPNMLKASSSVFDPLADVSHGLAPGGPSVDPDQRQQSFGAHACLAAPDAVP